MLHKAWNSKGEMLYCFPRSSIKFQGHTVQNITDFDPNWAFPDYRPVAAFKSLRFALLCFLKTTSMLRVDLFVSSLFNGHPMYVEVANNSPMLTSSPLKQPSTVECDVCCLLAQIARFMRPTWGPPGAYRTQVGPMMAPWTLLSGWLLLVTY